MRSSAYRAYSTNRNLEKAIQEKRFRQDLLYRLNVIQIELPPLRDRTVDIPMLVDHFLVQHCPKNRKPPVIGNKIMSALLDYPWPGNIRELENEVRRWLTLAGDEVTERDLSRTIRASLMPLGPDSNAYTLSELEKQHILQVLKRTSKDISKAAAVLGIDEAALTEKVKNHKIH